MGGARHYNNVGGRTPFGTPEKQRLQVFNDRVHRTQEWTKIYVEGLPQQVMMAQRGGIPHLRETIEDIMDWPLAEGTDFILAETAITLRYPTEHGRHGNAATYGLTLELGKREAYGQLTLPSFGASYSGTLGRQRARCVCRGYNTDGG